MRYAIAIDVGGTTIKHGIVGENGSTYASGATPTPADPAKLVAETARVVAALEDRIKAGEIMGEDGPITPADVIAPVGFDLPGIVEEDAGMAVFSANLGWRDFPAKAQLEAALGRPVGFGHDVRSGALAESEWGVGLDNFFYIAIGTGIASVLVLGGEAVAVSGWAGELGQISVPGWDGEPVSLESVSSAGSICRRGVELGLTEISTGAAGVYKLADEGNEEAAAIIEYALTQLARATSAVVAAVGAVPIVLGGGLANRGQDLFDQFAALLDRELGIVPCPQVIGASLGSDSQLMGSALRAFRLEAGH